MTVEGVARRQKLALSLKEEGAMTGSYLDLRGVGVSDSLKKSLEVELEKIQKEIKELANE